jgi:hypothetical protein
MGSSAGSAKMVTPPIIMPVRARVSSDVAKDSRGTPISFRTAWLTSRRRVALTTQAAYCFGSFFEATMMVLPDWSIVKP